jgi:hypothetical protein
MSSYKLHGARCKAGDLRIAQYSRAGLGSIDVISGH